jgi:uncharacterized membrane protein YadS
VIRARAGDVAYAMSTIFLFSIAAALSLPAIGHAMGSASMPSGGSPAPRSAQRDG